MSNYKTPADLGIEAVKAEKRISALLSEFSQFALESIDEHRDNFKTDISYLKACLDFLVEFKENHQEDEMPDIDEVLDQEDEDLNNALCHQEAMQKEEWKDKI